MTHPAEGRMPERRHLPAVVPGRPPVTLHRDDDVTGLEVAKELQHQAAFKRLSETHDDAPTLAFPDLERVTGPMLDGQLWVVLARPENGKTTFLLNVGRRWLRDGIGFAYFGTEEAADAATLRFAAIRVGRDPGAVVAGEWARASHPDERPDNGLWPAQIELAGELTRLRDEEPVYFAPDTRPTLGDVRRVAYEAKRLGLSLLVLDHFHRMAVPESHNQTATLAETVRQIKQLAVDTGLIIVMAAQAKRSDHPIGQYQPPPPDGGMGTSALEQEADVLLGLFRPLKRLPQKELNQRIKEFLAGDIERDEILMPHTMGVRVLKHRRNADLSGKTAFLHCEKGMLANHLHPIRHRDREAPMHGEAS